MTAPENRPVFDTLPVSPTGAFRGRRMSQTLLDLVDRPADLIGLPKDGGRPKTVPLPLSPQLHSSAGSAEGGAQRLPRPLHPGEVARRTMTEVTARRVQSRVEPVSQIWRAALLRDVVSPTAMAEAWLLDDQPVTAATGADGGRRLDDGVLERETAPQPVRMPSAATGLLSPRASAGIEPLELALNRLLKRPVQETAVTVPPTQVLQRMEAGGWRFKRSATPAPVRPEETQRGLARLQRPAPTRPIPAAPRTLLERVLQRDFAGVRVQMASLGALGVEAATQGSTVYLPPSAARLDSPDALALLGHELTHVAARMPKTVQRTPQDLPLAAPSLTRQLSQRLVQMSLAEEESTAEAVESTVRRSARGRSGVALRARPRATALLAQRTVDGHRFAPVSSLWHGDGAPLLPPESALPASTHPFAASANSVGDVLETMQAQGWRFKRSRPGAGGEATGLSADAVTHVQRAADTAQMLSARGGEMPLPVQPRSLLERVLQRDFSGVRMQVAGLEPLGVEAAARGNTVYLQRETAANLSAPKNLALLGHELTHVAAAGHAPVQRLPVSPSISSSISMSSAPDLATPLVQRSILPDLPSNRGSVAAEENTADRVEAEIRRVAQLQRVSTEPSLQSQTFTRTSSNASSSTASPLTLPLSPLSLRARQVHRVMDSPATSVLSPLTPSISQSTIQRTVALESVQRGQGATATSGLSGVTQSSMPVAQRYHVPVKRNGSEANGSEAKVDDGFTGTQTTTTSVPVSRIGEKITISAPRVQRVDDDERVDSNENTEPDWEKLVDKILPLLKNRLLVERDRFGW